MMAIDDTLIKKPEAYGSYGTVLGRSLLPSEAHGNLEVFIAILNQMLGSNSPTEFGARYGDAAKAWVPVGTEYTQYPGAAAPASLYLGTWAYYGQSGSGLSSRGGRFPRAEGGSYGGVLGNTGSNQNKEHRHTYTRYGTIEGSPGAAGAAALNNTVAANTGYEGGDEARPDFATVRYWKRTA
jgi:hypothetical protein